MQLELISDPLCPFVHRAAIMLREKGVAFARRDIDLRDKPAWFLAISPRGKVPVLVADGAALFESAAICEFLDETHPPRLMPDDPFARARERAWVEVASDLLVAQYRWMVAPAREDAEATGRALDGLLGRIEGALATGEFVADRLGPAAVAIAPAMFRFVVIEELTGANVLAPHPRLDAWARGIAARPSVRGTVAADFAARLQRLLDERGSFLVRGQAPA